MHATELIERIAAMLETIHTNVSGFLMEMGKAGGGHERDDHEIAWTVGGSPIDYHNAVVRCLAADTARANKLVAVFLDELRRHAVPGCWHLHPAMTPSGLDRILIEAGFEDGGPEPAMALRLTAPLPVPAAELSIELVGSDNAFDRYRQVLADGFGEGPAEAEWVTSTFKRIGTGNPQWRHFVGSVDGHPVATATVFRTANVAGIYFVATRPAFRRHGFGTAITSHALNDAFAAGADTAVLGSSSMGQSIYEALGFREHFEYRLFEARP